MRLIRLLAVLVTTILFTFACTGVDFLQPLPTDTPTATSPPQETATSTPTPTHTPSPTPSPPYPTSPPIPAWVTEFADPILKQLSNRKPDFQDDFSKTGAWFYRIPGSPRLYAQRRHKALLLKLPEEMRERDVLVYNPQLIRRNFVLSLEVRFDHAQPEDTIRFQFNQTADQSVVLDLTNNDKWSFRWDFHNNQQSHGGIYYHFPPETLPVTIIMLGKECAVYLSDVPLDYLSECRSGPIVARLRWAVSFHALTAKRHDLTVTFDNLKLWDLDKIAELP